VEDARDFLGGGRTVYTQGGEVVGGDPEVDVLDERLPAPVLGDRFSPLGRGEHEQVIAGVERVEVGRDAPLRVQQDGVAALAVGVGGVRLAGGGDAVRDGVVDEVDPVVALDDDDPGAEFDGADAVADRPVGGRRAAVSSWTDSRTVIGCPASAPRKSRSLRSERQQTPEPLEVGGLVLGVVRRLGDDPVVGEDAGPVVAVLDVDEAVRFQPPEGGLDLVDVGVDPGAHLEHRHPVPTAVDEGVEDRDVHVVALAVLALGAHRR
jgi:hypothetical protein